MSPNRKHILWYVLGIILLGFIILTTLVSAFPYSVIDREFSEEIQEHQHPIMDSLMKYISAVGIFPYSVIMVLCTALIFYVSKLRKEALYVCFTMVSGLVSASLKIIINRPRPTEDLVRIVEKATRNSFPSGHVLFYVVFFGFLILLMYRLKAIPKLLRILIGSLSAFLVFTIPFSRVYLGAHWFTDVLAGFLLGMLCLLILSYLYLRKPQ